MSATGTWNVTMSSFLSLGPQPITLELTEDGNDVDGTASSPALGGVHEIEEATIDGNSVTWRVSIMNPMPTMLVFNGTIDGDAISGMVQLGTLGLGETPFAGTRAS